MGFEDWVAEQEQNRSVELDRRAADDIVRAAHAAHVITALTAELRTVVPRVRAIPCVTVQEHYVEVSTRVTGAVTVRPRIGTNYEAPAGHVTSRCIAVGAAREAWKFGGMWLDEDGHLWFEVDVRAHGALYDHSFAEPRTAGAHEKVKVPLRAHDAGRWVRAGGDAPAEATIDGHPWSIVGPHREVAGAPFHVTQSLNRGPRFFKGTTWVSTMEADLLRGDPADTTVGFKNYDALPTVARDFIFRTVQSALQQGRRTL